MSMGWMGWPIEQTAAMRDLWHKGHSFGQIAKILGLSRNAVIGKAHRMGLHREYNAVAEGKRSARRMQSRIAQANTRAKRGKIPRWALVKVKERSYILDAGPDPLNISLENIEPNQCRFIAGDDRLFCGHETKPGSSWCAHHLLVVSAQR